MQTDHISNWGACGKGNVVRLRSGQTWGGFRSLLERLCNISLVFVGAVRARADLSALSRDGASDRDRQWESRGRRGGHGWGEDGSRRWWGRRWLCAR